MILLEPIRITLPQNQAIMEGQGESSMVRIFHHIVACEAFYVHNNIVIYFERRKTVPEELLHPAYMYPSCNSYSTDLCYITRRHKKIVEPHF